MPRLAKVLAGLAALACLAWPPASAFALPGAHVSATKFVKHVDYPDTQHLHYEYGPIDIAPGQNNIEARSTTNKPKVPGYITRFKPNLVYSYSHKVPRVDVIHLHHGVWIVNGGPTFAAGEEKTTAQLPRGYGYHYNKSDSWIMNYMLHNLTPEPTKVSITYDIDFVPDTAPAAKDIVPAHPLWMDVAGVSAYPVFDAYKGQGKHGKFTFPESGEGVAAGRHRPRPPVHRHSGHDPREHGGPPASRRPLHGPQDHARRHAPRSCSGRWPSTSSRRARSPGTSR